MPTQLPRTAAFDLETTARPGEDARIPEQAVPVQAALVYVHPPGDDDPHGDVSTVRAVLGSADVHTPDGYPHLIDPGCPVDPASTKVHGITDAMVDGADDDYTATARLCDLLWQAHHKGYVLCAANAHYDLTVLHRRMHYYNPDTTTDHLGPITVVDPMVIDRWADKYRRGSRTLTDLCGFYGVPLGEDAHDAGADAQAAGLLVARMFEVAAYLAGDARLRIHPDHAAIAAVADRITTPDRFRLIAEMGAAELHAAQVAWHLEWAAGFQTWLRTKAPAERRDPDAVVSGAWPVIPLPAPA